MLNFIICEDDAIFRNEVVKEIDRFMMRSDIDYKIHQFDSYDKNFEEITKTDLGFKVYLLDIKTSYGSGMDAARYIREEIDDWVSILIIITAFSEYRYEALTNRLYLLDFINKLDNCTQKLREALAIVMKNYGNRDKSLSFEYNYMIHKVEFRNILYIEKEPNSKRCYIHTTFGDYKIHKTLSQLEQVLDKRFLKVNRSVVINLDLIRTYDSRNNYIDFINGTRVNAVSRTKKKILIKKVLNEENSLQEETSL